MPGASSTEAPGPSGPPHAQSLCGSHAQPLSGRLSPLRRDIRRASAPACPHLPFVATADKHGRRMPVLCSWPLGIFFLSFSSSPRQLADSPRGSVARSRASDLSSPAWPRPSERGAGPLAGARAVPSPRARESASGDGPNCRQRCFRAMHFSVPGLIHLPSAQVRRPEAGPLLLLGLRERPPEAASCVPQDRQGTPLGDEQPVPGKGPQRPGIGDSSRSGRRISSTAIFAPAPCRAALFSDAQRRSPARARALARAAASCGGRRGR